jgi:hypothetical protein
MNITLGRIASAGPRCRKVATPALPHSTVSGSRQRMGHGVAGLSGSRFGVGFGKVARKAFRIAWRSCVAVFGVVAALLQGGNLPVAGSPVLTQRGMASVAAVEAWQV